MRVERRGVDHPVVDEPQSAQVAVEGMADDNGGAGQKFTKLLQSVLELVRDLSTVQCCVGYYQSEM